jgi:hypothetical protein
VKQTIYQLSDLEKPKRHCVAAKKAACEYANRRKAPRPHAELLASDRGLVRAVGGWSPVYNSLDGDLVRLLASALARDIEFGERLKAHGKIGVGECEVKRKIFR